MIETLESQRHDGSIVGIGSINTSSLDNAPANDASLYKSNLLDASSMRVSEGRVHPQPSKQSARRDVKTNVLSQERHRMQSVNEPILPQGTRRAKQENAHSDNVGSHRTHVSATETTHQSSLGNRISTFFGQHRSSPPGSHRRPSTPQSLLQPLGAGQAKDSRTAKRNLFGIPASKYRQETLPSRTDREVKEEQNGFTARPEVTVVGHPSSHVRDSTDLSRCHDVPTVKGGHAIFTATAIPSLPLRISSPSSYTVQSPEYNGQSKKNPSITEGGSSIRQTTTASISLSSLQCNSGADHDRESQRKSTSASSYTGRLLGTSDTAWNHWGAPPDAISGVYHDPRMDREKQFSWVTNPSLSDGREVMGFGGDLGKKRLHVAGQSNRTRAFSDFDMNDGAETDGKGQVPYIIGFERQVLAL